MSRRDGSWLLKLEGHPEVSTDDLTLDELETAERACDVPYTLMDPHVSIRIAKALLGVMLTRANLAAGMEQKQAEDQALKAAGKLPVRKLHGAFTYVPATKPPAAAGGAPADPPALAPTSSAG